jgi:hypothetical protein
VIEAVADRKPVRDLEADVANRQIHTPALGLGEQRADLERARLAGAQVLEQIVQGQPGIDDVLDQEHIAIGDRGVEVLEDPDHARGVGRRAITGDRHEVDLARDFELPHQVGEEEDGALEHADHHQVATGVVAVDLGAELDDPPLQLLGLDQGLADVRVVHGPQRRRSTKGVRPGRA